LKVDKILHMHNYSEEKKMAMPALYRENAGQGDVRSWAKMKRER
jgi:hypothetical protein